MTQFCEDKFSLLVDGGMHGVSEKLRQSIRFVLLVDMQTTKLNSLPS